MANSRDLVRSDTLLTPPRAGRCGFRGFAELSRKLPHLERTKTRFETFVAPLQARAVNRLFERVAGQHTKHDRHPRIHLRELQATRSLRADVIIMRGFPSEDAPNGDHGTCTTSTSSPFAPPLVRASSAASSRRSVMKLLNRLTTIPSRKPAPLKLPAILLGSILSVIAIINFP